jgi:homocysteine S-methyltransferase
LNDDQKRALIGDDFLGLLRFGANIYFLAKLAAPRSKLSPNYTDTNSSKLFFMSLRQSKFTQLLRRDRPLLLDGGLATQLETHGCDIGNDLWSASLLSTDPESIVLAHRAYLLAGAECIATASYQASREGYAKLGVSGQDADSLMLLSVELASRACREAGSGAAVAASLGPYGAMLHDGSEYSGNYGVSSQVLRDFHRIRLQLFDRAGVDVIAVETIPSLQEAQVLSELLRKCETPSWISFSCGDAKHLCDGTSLATAASLFRGHPTVVAVGVNCMAPKFTPALVSELCVAVPDKFAIAYPNAGESYDVSGNNWSGHATLTDSASAAAQWLAAGAKIIGGCCRTGPDDIRAMRNMIDEDHQEQPA